MKLSDLARDKDPLFELLDSMNSDDEKRSKKGKKKKKKKSKEIKARWMAASGAPNLAELQDMSKSDLRDYIVKMGIKANSIDLTSKKAMRNCIKEHFGLKGSSTSAALAAVSDGKPAKEPKLIISKKSDAPPYWYDEETGEFVIADARDTDPLNCYNGMSALGEIRRKARPDDGFGVLMDTLTKRIVEEAHKPKLESPVIEAEFEVIDEVPPSKALTEPKPASTGKKK